MPRTPKKRQPSVICSQLGYAYSKFSSAAYMMASSSKAMRERLWWAADEVGPALLHKDGIPEHVRKQMRGLWARLNSCGGRDTTLAVLSDAEIARLGRDLVDVSVDLVSEFHRASEREAVERALAAKKPRRSA